MDLKLILPRITKDTPHSGGGEWLPWTWEGVFHKFLNAHEIWPDHKNSKLSYNPVYHFFDYTVFPDPNNRRDTPESVGKAICSLFSKWTKTTDAGRTWRWAGGKQVIGRRVWIEAYEDHS